jgi:hypothetical protein
MQQLLQLVEKEKLGKQPVTQHTLIIDDKQVIHGALFFVKTARKTFKIMVPTTYYEALLTSKLTVQNLLKHPEAMLLS